MSTRLTPRPAEERSGRELQLIYERRASKIVVSACRAHRARGHGIDNFQHLYVRGSLVPYMCAPTTHNAAGPGESPVCNRPVGFTSAIIAGSPYTSAAHGFFTRHHGGLSPDAPGWLCFFFPRKWIFRVYCVPDEGWTIRWHGITLIYILEFSFSNIYSVARIICARWEHCTGLLNFSRIFF